MLQEDAAPAAGRKVVMTVFIALVLDLLGEAAVAAAFRTGRPVSGQVGTVLSDGADVRVLAFTMPLPLFPRLIGECYRMSADVADL
jgi:hypothetical protein